MATIEAGMSGADFISALNKDIDTVTEYNVKKYGAIGNGVANDTAAIQALIETAKVAGGTIYFPPGTYKTNTLTLYNNVMLRGDMGSRSVILSSVAAEPLINLIHTEFFGTNSVIRHMVLSGAGVGTIGLVMQWVGLFYIEDVTFASFKTRSVHMIGSLVGQFNNCVFGTTAGTGVYAEYYTADSIACNDVLFKGCQFYQSQEWAVNYTYGASLMFENCSFEVNGTPDVADSGCVKTTRGESSTGIYWHGLLMKNCWFEANRGTVIDLEGFAAQEQMHVIETSMFNNNNASGGLTIKVNGANTQKVVLRNCLISDNNAINIEGANAVVINETSVITGTIAGVGYINTIDVNGIISLPVQANPPNPAVEGQIYADTDHHLYYYNGTEWKQLDN